MVSVHLPALIQVPAPRSVPVPGVPSQNSTASPALGAAVPGETTVTVAVSETDWPNTGDDELEVTTVLVVSAPTVTLTPGEVDAESVDWPA